MFLARIPVGCAAFILISGCSVLFKGSGQYVSLPRHAVAGALLSLNKGSNAVPKRIVAPAFREQGAGIDPLAALRRSEAARAGWEELRPTGLAEVSLISRLTSGAEEGERPARPPVDPGYNRGARMSRLLEEGLKAAKPICVGC